MISAAIFAMVGVVCGFLLRMPAFLIATCLILVAYAIAISGSQTAASIAVEIVLGLVSLQVGYCATVLIRIGLARARR